jgi:hypothetical protein
MSVRDFKYRAPLHPIITFAALIHNCAACFSGPGWSAPESLKP